MGLKSDIQIDYETDDFDDDELLQSDNEVSDLGIDASDVIDDDLNSANQLSSKNLDKKKYLARQRIEQLLEKQRLKKEMGDYYNDDDWN